MARTKTRSTCGRGTIVIIDSTWDDGSVHDFRYRTYCGNVLSDGTVVRCEECAK